MRRRGRKCVGGDVCVDEGVEGGKENRSERWKENRKKEEPEE